jgi:hypothetical protein
MLIRKGPPLWSSGQSSWLQNGDVLSFLWGTNWIYTCYAEESRPPIWSSGQSSWLQNGDVLWLLWGKNWIYIWYVEESRCLCGLAVRVPGYRFRGSGFDSRHNQIFWEVVGLERGPLSLVNTTEELLRKKNRGSDNTVVGDPPRWLRDTLYLQKLALSLPTSGARSVGIVRSRTQATAIFITFW